MLLFSVVFAEKTDNRSVLLNQKNMELNKEDNKKIVESYYLKVTGQEYKSAMSEYLSVNYIEHQETADFSKEGLQKFYEKRLKKYPTSKTTIHRIIAQDDLVFLHVEEKISEKLTYTHGELFRIKDSKIIEHWSAIQEHPKELKSGRRMYDGQAVDYSKNTGIKYTEYTKQSYLDAFTLPVPEAVKAIDATTTKRYFQHNPNVADGVEPFKAAPKKLKSVAKIGLKTTLDIKMTVSEGDFVVTLSYFRLPVLLGNQIVFDLFRVMDDGKKDEHWDVGEKFKKKNIDKVF